jgi:hypothetical protein
MTRHEAPGDVLLAVGVRAAELLLVMLLAAVLTACGTVQDVREVPTPVAVPCLDASARPTRPALRSEAELFELEPYRRTHAIYAEWLRQRGYIGELEAAVDGCSKIPALEPPAS